MSDVTPLAALRRDGVCHLHKVLGEPALARCRSAATEQLNTVLRHMLLRQVLTRPDREDEGQATPSGPARYQEVVERDGGRLDVRHHVTDTVVATALRSPALQELLLQSLGVDAEVVAAGNVVAMSVEGWLTSLAGADGDSDDDAVVLSSDLGPQAWHADGPHLFDSTTGQLPAHALTVFVPLVDLTAENGPTEFKLGSHVRGCEYQPEGDEGVDCVAADASASATRSFHAAAGDAVVFDYRLWHRGGANASAADRQVLYLVVAKPWWRDARNFNQGESLLAKPGVSKAAPAADGGDATATLPLRLPIAGFAADRVEERPAASRKRKVSHA